jgi:putative protease
MTAAAPQPMDLPGAQRRAPRLPELLAPAGDWECARAAVENGADAIYFGLEKFNARMRANNFTEADLPKLMEFLHRRGVKGYVTFNILVFENELAQAEQHLRAMIAAGVDAAIVQDVGVCRLIRRVSPDFPIHVSTQMTVTSAAGVAFARELGCNLVVLARECSLKEIERIANPGAGALPLEVFVHGALCVAYSGQCLTSEVLGGRSANRGECAQACRLPYELVSDGLPVPLGDRKYLLSPQDLAGLPVLPDLVRAGVASLKIEGRLKAPEYVANITRVYRHALDRIAGEMGNTGAERPAERGDPQTQYDMEMAFSRGLYTGWFRGVNNQALVHARFGKKRGVYLGEIARVGNDHVELLTAAPLKLGDGVVFDAGHPEAPEQGGRIYEIKPTRGQAPGTGGRLLLRFGHGAVDFKKIHVGDKLWKTSDPELDRRLRQTYEGETPRYQRPLEMETHGAAGQPMTLIARDEDGHTARVESSLPLAAATKQPLTTGRLREQLGRLGGTAFALGGLDNQLAGAVILPMSELNRMRRDVVAQLDAQRARPPRWTVNEPRRAEAPVATAPPAGAAELIVLVRTVAQMEAALDCGVATIYCEFEDPKRYREAVARFREHRPASVEPVEKSIESAREIWVAPPRIFKAGEEWTLKQVRSCDADGYLVRNYDHLSYFDGERRIGDYSLNVANHLAADYFKNRFGLERLTASYDLNFTQLEALLRAAPAAWFDITLHQHMPMFHMEHCVFCAFLSSGTDYTNCGRPCDRHDLRLRDRAGALHPIKADAGCRNTVFNSLAQTGADYAARMLALGARHFRVEFLNETAEQVAQTIPKYRQLLAGTIDGPRVWRELRLLSQLGVTRGQMGQA